MNFITIKLNLTVTKVHKGVLLVSNLNDSRNMVIYYKGGRYIVQDSLIKDGGHYNSLKSAIADNLFVLLR